MTREGVDYSLARPTRAQLVAAGATFACRYLLDPGRNRGKRLTAEEARQLNDWGLDVVSNFEFDAGGWAKGTAQGQADARVALAEITALGIPRDVVYFSVDTDVPANRMPVVLNYLAGCSVVLGKQNVGVYGSYAVVEAAHAAGYRWLWQTYAWSGGRQSVHATIYQYSNSAFAGWDGDKNRALVDDFGQWNLLDPSQGGSDVSFSDEITIDAGIAKLSASYLVAGSKLSAGYLLQLAVLKAHLGSQTAYGVASLVQDLVKRVAVLEGASAEDAARDAALKLSVAGVLSEIHDVGAAVTAGGADPQVIADRLAAALGPQLGPAVAEALGHASFDVVMPGQPA
jgi:Domain of unknown function (DUF1906)